MTRAVTDAQLLRRLATNVRRLRTDARLTIERAAELAQLSTRVWDRVEAGTSNATVHTLVSIGRALQVDPAELLLDPPAPPAPAAPSSASPQAGPTRRPRPR